ncbi:MAG TPA: hypothetical protein VEL82_06425 [Thermoplasmata archaeon]|nr:hypothetical protein [Thermoplasmata archaeon]
MTYGDASLAYALWIVIIALGAAVALYAFRAARSSHSSSLLLLGVGFVLISVAAGGVWMGAYSIGDDPILADVGACVAMAAGFGAVLASLWIRTA